ncbi:hypothetical protein D9613_007047 [Agrocybe pediades]|uniref:F-box domain-containing protein n=1 Tax=Agrocybe pediades TaxID=84607 RepID=A0A8H4VK54_9AGAR|nr:hypothetical protein D9613_007047 [Agrocybe pediades]
MPYPSELLSTDSALCTSCTFKTENICASDIELHIGTQESLLVPFKIRNNSFAPISRLAPEVLCTIFYHLMNIPGPARIIGNLSPLQRSDLHWIQVTHVCHAWREIALNCSSLWTRPPFNLSDRWAAEMLQRSKSTTIYVDIDYASDRPPKLDIALAALSQMQRIYGLRVISPDVDTFKKLVERLPESAPELELLTLIADIWPAHIRFKLPDEALNEMPRLLVLGLIGLEINWDRHLSNLNGLAGLRIESITPAARPTNTQFLNAISQAAPTLETLILGQAFPIASLGPASEPDDACLRRIAFPRLRNVRLQSSSSLELVAFLDAVTFMPSTVVSISCKESIEGNVPRAFCNAIRPSLFNEDAIVLQDLDISSTHEDDDTAIIIRLFAVERRSLADCADAQPKYTLTLRTRPSTIDHFLVDNVLALPLSNVTCLTMQWEDENTFTRIRDPYECAIFNMSRLFFECAMKSFFVALKGLAPSGRSLSELQGTGILLPKLQHVKLRRLHLTQNALRSGDVLLIERLVEYLTWRKERGAELSSVHAMYCSELEPSQVAALQGLCTEVVLTRASEDEDENEWRWGDESGEEDKDDEGEEEEDEDDEDEEGSQPE